MDEHPLLSEVALSNLYTKAVASRHDPRQALPERPGLPPEEVRRLCAQLILEEALETIQALGYRVNEWGMLVDRVDPPEFEKIIDGACDTVYVATGLLVACGVPDKPHLREVCRANNSKMAGGKVVLDPSTGKYLKPAGWSPPDHSKVLSSCRMDMRFTSARLVAEETGYESS